MSSIRPLATITVLALVGVFLYMKINETEPPLPEGVEDWSAATAIEFDMGVAGAEPQFTTSSPAGEAPAYASPAGSVTAPAFNPADSAPPLAVPAAGSLDSVAPAFGDTNSAGVESSSSAANWSDAPTSNPGAADANSTPWSASVDEQASVSNGAESIAAPRLPDLPPLPALPSAGFTEPKADAPVDTTVPQTASSAYSTRDPAASVTSDSGQSTLPPLTSARVATESSNVSALNPDRMGTTATSVTQTESSPYSATRLAVQAALDRGELSQALLLLSDWYGDPSLSPSDAAEVNSLLSQLAGSVIYSTEHRLVPSYMVQAGERLETIAKEYDVPWQLLAKINGITSADQLQPGQELKVVRGPFSALIDLSQRKLTVMLDRRYAGQFALDVDLDVTVEEGQWEVNQKLLTPANVGLPGGNPSNLREERSLMLSSASAGASQVAILRGSASSNSLADPTGRVLRLSPTDAADVFDILSLGSRVVIRR